MGNNDHLADIELSHMADAVEDDLHAGELEDASMLQKLYLDRVHEKRQHDAGELLEAISGYLAEPGVSSQHPSLMDACDGNVMSAAKYVIWLMLQASMDGQEITVRFAAQECEKCFADLVFGDGKLRA